MSFPLATTAQMVCTQFIYIPLILELTLGTQRLITFSPEHKLSADAHTHTLGPGLGFIQVHIYLLCVYTMGLES